MRAQKCIKHSAVLTTVLVNRYANQAKRIVNKAVINEDATATMVRKLSEEIAALKEQLAASDTLHSHSGQTKASTVASSAANAALAAQLAESQALMDAANLSWEEKLANTRKMQVQRLLFAFLIPAVL